MNIGINRRLAIFAFLGVNLLLGEAVAQTEESPSQFISKIYDQYSLGKPAPDFLGSAADELFTPRLLKLIRADQALANGEAGLLDRDPICACQDYHDIGVKNIDVKTKGHDEATASVGIENAGKKMTIIFSLVRAPGGWKIDDIEEDQIHSLRAFLERGIKKYG
jgi:hypothetical protein